MTRIHHATAKKAEDNNIVLGIDDEGLVVASYASKKCGNIVTKMTLAPKVVLELAILRKTLAEEYSSIDVEFIEGVYVLMVRKPRDETEFDWDEVPSLAEVLDAATELKGHILDDEDEDDEDDTGSIVKSAYKEIYRQRGNPNNCGDWLAKFLDDTYTIEAIEVGKANGKSKKVKSFDVTSFTELLELNGVDFSGKWAQLPNSGQKGWRGRYRMNGRQKLEIVIAINGVLRTNQGEVHPEGNWLEEIQAKHAKAIKKHQDKLDKILGVTDE